MVRDPRTRADEPAVEDVLGALGDGATRTIIEELDEPMTANELSEACDIPLSTMYRKLEQLTNASLVTESTEIRRSGQHTTRYLLAFDSILVSRDDENSLAVRVGRPEEDTADRRLERLWSQVREET
ncbi:helix-turn-helix domain-containing protein [Haloferacaceae archaeon DSL9]